MVRRHRRRVSPLADVAASSRRGPWWRPLVIGCFSFLLVGVVYPLFVLHLLADAEVRMFRPILDQVLGRRWYGAYMIGTACLLLGAGLSAWKLWTSGSLSKVQLHGASFLSRLLARWVT